MRCLLLGSDRWESSLIEELLDVESDFKALLVKARRRHRLRAFFPRPYLAGYCK